MAVAMGVLVLAACGGYAGSRQVVTGLLVRVGGPATLNSVPPPVRLPGEVTARGAGGQEFRVAVGSDGRFRLSLPSGTYRLTGQSPRAAGGTCRAARAIQVGPRQPVRNVWVVCSIS